MWIAMALLSTAALAQPTPTPTPTPAASLSPSPTPKSAAETIVDQVAAAVRSGHLAVDVLFRPGKSPTMESWSLETVGAPTAHLTIDAAEGRVQSLDYHVDGGDLVFVGRGLRPSVIVQAISVDARGILQKAAFHGRGIGRPLVALFRPLVLSSLKKIRFHTEVTELLRGNLVVGSEASARAAAARTPPAGASPAATLDLVAAVRISDSKIGLFEDRHLDIGTSLAFETARDPEGHDPLVLAIESATYRPARGSDAGELAMRGALDCRLKNGQLAFNDGRLAFATGRLAAARFEVARGESGALETKLSASRLALVLTSGRYRGPAGVVVDLAEGSRFELADLAVTPAGSVSGTLDATLLGKTGEINRQGSRIALSDVRVETKGLRLSENRATGEMAVDFDYRLRYPFVVKYPVASLKERRVPLDFSGPLSARLHLEDVGAGEEGTVTGTYTFKAPWEPIEKAAFEAIRAQWEQNAPVIERVSLSVDPTAFRPCGKGCFYTKFRFVAEKRQKKKSIFREECGPEGKADLVIDKDARAFVLSNVKIRPECKGIVGWVVNLIAPLLTKTYNDMVLFKMPEDLPFTIETVDGDGRSITLTGQIRWAASGKGSPPPSEIRKDS
jgi:hypothetical protein